MRLELERVSRGKTGGFEIALALKDSAAGFSRELKSAELGYAAIDIDGKQERLDFFRIEEKTIRMGNEAANSARIPALLDRIASGSRLAILFRVADPATGNIADGKDRPIASFALRGSSAALDEAKACIDRAGRGTLPPPPPVAPPQTSAVTRPPAPSKPAPIRVKPSNDRSQWVDRADLPEANRYDGFEVHYRLSVGASGSVTGCRITRSSGTAAIDRAVCRALERHARFTPAKRNGMAVEGYYEHGVRASRKERPDLSRPPRPTGNMRTWVQTNDVPPRRGEFMASLSYVLQVDRYGNVTRCVVSWTSGHVPTDNAVCAALRNRATFSPARDRDGDPVSGRYEGRVQVLYPQ